MYETEISTTTLTSAVLPNEITAPFSVNDKSITHRSLIAWEEHCTECTMPSCFSTCEYYTPRSDLKCRRFEDGIVGVSLPNGITSHLMKITFRKWGKLEGRGTTQLFPLSQALQKERMDVRLSALQHSMPIPYGLNILGARIRRKFKEPKRQTAPDSTTLQPNCFIIECYNPSASLITISVTMRPTAVANKVQFQHFMELEPGYNFVCLPLESITRFIDLEEDFLIQLQPQPDMPGLVLYFGAVDFAINQDLQARAPAAPAGTASPKPKKIKCVVWDLDNTLWSGTLIEDGEAKLVLNEEAVKLIKNLDERGILNSIASKNNAEEALAVLKKYDLEDYFLYPDISWGPKSLALERIATRLNIGIDTFAFIDDQPFERAEVSETLPGVLCFDVTEIDTILNNPAFDVPVSKESKGRRHLYKDQIEREEAEGASEGDYEKFLISCNLQLTAAPLSEQSLDRVYELAQRTNQMNFSGNRYSRDALSSIMENPDLATYVLSCQDRFGDYGVIGFSIVRISDATMQDLMFSCRIQSKRVDHAFLTHVIRKFHQPGKQAFKVEYKESPKNTPSAQIFSDMGFIETDKDDQKSILSYPDDVELPTNNIVTVNQK